MGITGIFKGAGQTVPSPIYQYDALGNLSGYFYPQIETSPGIGMGYKFHPKGLNAIRTSFLLAFANNSSDASRSAIQSSFVNESNSLALDYRLGYEFAVDLQRVHFYFGPEFILSHFSGNFTSSNQYTQSNGVVDPITGLPVQQTIQTTNSVDFNSTGLGGGVFLGFRFFVNHALSIGLETKIDGVFKQETQKNQFDSSSGIPVRNSNNFENKSSSFVLSANPIGLLSFNIHL